jgi:hypothetical protein
MAGNDLHIAHELDAAWLIALWKAIHGGDPSSEAVAGQIIAVLAPYATNSRSSLTVQQLEEGLGNAGIEVKERFIQEDKIEARPHEYCFTFGDQTICIDLQARQIEPQAGVGG